jgi:hypothetical protein
VYPYKTVGILPLTCYPWNTSSSTSTRRNVDGSVDAWPVEGSASCNLLSTRGVVDSLFPDGLASMIACPTDFHSDTGDCNVKVGEYTDDYAEVAARDASDAEIGHDDDGTCKLSLWTGMDAPTEGNGDATLNEPDLAVSKLAKRGTKEPFFFCDKAGRNKPKNIITRSTTSKLSFPGSGDMIRKKNGYTEDSFLSYGPLNPGDCDDYSFGKLDTPPASKSLEFASEHVLEWQILKKFLEDSPKIPRLDAIRLPIPAASGFKKGKLGVYDPEDRWKYCSYMWFWWSNAAPPMTYHGLRGYPIDILNKAIPNKENYQSELQLLSNGANDLKERLCGTGDVRQDKNMEKYVTSDVNIAINYCKQVMFAVKYVSETRRIFNHHGSELAYLHHGFC